MRIPKEDIILYFAIGTAILLLVGFFVVLFILVYNKRHRQFEMDRIQFQQTLLESQLEIQEQTMKNISQEIHDNIGQVLSLAKLNLATAHIEPSSPAKSKIDNAHTLVGRSIADLRNLSRSLDADYISEKTLQGAIAFELELIEKTGNHKVQFLTEGEPVQADKQKELIVFRIIQECLNNAIKHAAAKEITLRLEYSSIGISISVGDDGKGFDMNTTEKGLGLRNMQNRAKLIGATLSITSVPGKGTTTSIILPL